MRDIPDGGGLGSGVTTLILSFVLVEPGARAQPDSVSAQPRGSHGATCRAAMTGAPGGEHERTIWGAVVRAAVVIAAAAAAAAAYLCVVWCGPTAAAAGTWRTARRVHLW